MNEERALELVRARLLAPGKLSEDKLARSLLPYTKEPSPERGRAAWDRLVARLRERGEVAPDRLALTEAGVAATLASLGLEAAPRRASFHGLMRLLCAKALGAGARKRPLDADRLRAALLGRPLGLSAPTLQQAVDAMVWRALGLEADGPLTLKKLRERVLARELGQERVAPLSRSIRLAAAKAAGAPRTETQALVDAVLADWLGGAASTPEAPSLEAFAALALDAARDPDARRFTPDKTFIDSAWERARARGGPAGELAEFKARLLQAHRARLLVLSRADLTQLIDPAELAASAIQTEGGAFHFVRTDAPEARR